MSVRFRVALLALLTLTVAFGPVAAGGAALSAVASADASQTTETPRDPIPPETTAISIELEDNGDAILTIRTRVGASTDAQREAFRAMAQRYERGEQSSPWLAEARAAADAASEATGRPMNVTDPRISSTVNTTTLQVRFTWTNFAREEGDHMVVDDAFNTTRGTWLDRLTESQHLTIELPEGTAVVSAPKGAIVQNARVEWLGPRQFGPGYMRVVYSGDDGPQTTPTENPENRDGLLWGGFLVFGLGILAVGAYVFSRRRGGLPAPATDDDPDAPPASAPSPAPKANGDTGTSTADTGGPTATDDNVDEELLSDEERVERLLDSNGGRMKQANIVTETGWSNAKVSQLLSSMAEDGKINKLRIGRENLISFPEEDVTDIDQN